MRISKETYHETQWLVFNLALDFRFYDAWSIKVADINEFNIVEFYEKVIAERKGVNSRISKYLFFIRAQLGRVKGWDTKRHERFIPNCQEISLKERLNHKARQADESDRVGEPKIFMDVKKVYLLPDEFLLEGSNKLLHVLLHFAYSKKSGEVHLGVFVKSRDWQGRLYMALIHPLRTAVIYPAWIRTMENSILEFQSRTLKIPHQITD